MLKECCVFPFYYMTSIQKRSALSPQLFSVVAELICMVLKSTSSLGYVEIMSLYYKTHRIVYNFICNLLNVVKI